MYSMKEIERISFTLLIFIRKEKQKEMMKWKKELLMHFINEIERILFLFYSFSIFRMKDRKKERKKELCMSLMKEIAINGNWYGKKQ